MTAKRAPTDSDSRRGCLAGLLNLLRRDHRTAPTASEGLPYRLRDQLLTPAELNFYRAVAPQLERRFILLTKVRLADVVAVDQQAGYFAHFNRISAKHLDFLICDADSLIPQAALELDDASHQRPNRRARDEFVDQVCAAAGLPLIRVPARTSYPRPDLCAYLDPYLVADDTPAASPPVPSGPPDRNGPLCPACGIPMVLRTAAKGEHQGKQFYGCRNFPTCRQMKPAP